ncbi:unnamed protein product [Adineta steineri]|uniref:Aminotransferase class V domain-containing protein n=2 Tax=Adineta steineri TaxID=433720 RepID=A0A819S9L9_9BILA|nr:unnamed protein product [Adineta steineri]
MTKIEFGEKTRLDHYLMDQELVYVNQGSYGPCPRFVYDELQRIRLLQEGNPDHWFRSLKYTLYADCVRAAANRLDCNFEQITLVDNATVGVNALIKSSLPTSRPISNGTILCTNLGYGSVLFTIEEAAKQRGWKVRMINIQHPIENKQSFIQQFQDELNKGDVENIRLAVIDHITSATAILLPIVELTDLLHSYKIPVLVDGAHGPGQAVPHFSLNKLTCDYYVGTFHKWMYAARGCSFLFIRNTEVANQIQPANTSWGYRPSALQLDAMTHFHLQFFHQGTRDESALFTLPKAIEFADQLAGGFDEIYQYNSTLSQEAKTLLEQRWNTQGKDIVPKDMQAPYLKMIQLPDLEEYKKTEEDALRLLTDLIRDYKLVAIILHLRSLCIRKLISNEKYLISCLQQKSILLSTPGNIFYSIGQEAIFMNEYQIIEILIAYWPLNHLEIYRLLPLSSLLVYINNNQQQDDEIDSIAKFLEKKLPDGSTLLDYIVMGLVNKHKDLSLLKIVDFHRCSTTIQMTKELFRLPLLWIAPERRSLLQKRMYIEKTKLEKYIEGFNYVYQYYDKSIAHETNFEPMKIILDCQIINEDTLVGLELQQLTPFRFHFRKLWINNYVRQILTSHTSFDINLVLNLTNVDNITHLHLSDTNMETTENELTLLVRSLSNLRNLRVLCLQRVLNLYPHRYTAPHILTNLCTDFNRLLRRLIYLRRLDLSYSYLQSYIRILFSGLIQPLEYLNLQDCRLVSKDLEFLLSMRNLRYFKELNLSMNNFGTRTCANLILQIIPRCPELTILSIGYCSLQASAIGQLADYYIKEKTHTKISLLSFKSIIPYYNYEFDILLQKFGQIKTLKKLLLFPQLHTYPGVNDDERELVARELYRRCCQTLQTLNRQDLELL